MVNIDKIKELTNEHDWSMSKLCEKINKSTSYFTDIRKNKAKMSDDILILIADILDTTPEYLRDESDIKYKKPTATLRDELWYAICKNDEKLRLAQWIATLDEQELRRVEKLLDAAELLDDNA